MADYLNYVNDTGNETYGSSGASGGTRTYTAKAVKRNYAPKINPVSLLNRKRRREAINERYVKRARIDPSEWNRPFTDDSDEEWIENDNDEQNQDDEPNRNEPIPLTRQEIIFDIRNLVNYVRQWIEKNVTGKEDNSRQGRKIRFDSGSNHLGEYGIYLHWRGSYYEDYSDPNRVPHPKKRLLMNMVYDSDQAHFIPLSKCCMLNGSDEEQQFVVAKAADVLQRFYSEHTYTAYNKENELDKVIRIQQTLTPLLQTKEEYAESLPELFQTPFLFIINILDKYDEHGKNAFFLYEPYNHQGPAALKVKVQDWQGKNPERDGTALLARLYWGQPPFDDPWFTRVANIPKEHQLREYVKSLNNIFATFYGGQNKFRTAAS